ncbi:hypothetical protein JQN72_13800 [Phycicoccus sp. CSK15P-2]|uniref:hypothetical protein n=1 Tax=Phycicoccus sp. CSK15P-2 TaxID=2807627 RepID=UPI00194F1FE7|nr:hypothetical protein [Phycicoccus sp. CSK15P-2]MBM6405314.1 hypothetical protein [Phycicoccus sp. CSK15P-2]
MGVAWTLAGTVGVAVPPQVAVAAVDPQAPAAVASAADLVSAQLTAKAQGARVEVEAMRTETSTTWVNPDGSLTTQEHAAPVRFRDGSGVWREVDLGVVESADGSAAPKRSRVDVSFAGRTKGARGRGRSAAGTDLASVDEGKGRTTSARQVALGWPGTLPAPALRGTRATYSGVKPGVDVVLEARRSGFEQLTVVKDRAALEGLTDADGRVAVSLPLRTQGLTARVEDDGSVGFVDGTGAVASRIAPPVAWDAVVDEHSGDHANVSPVAVEVEQQGKGKAVLTLVPDAQWIADPARVFPITIDPTYATGSNVTTSFDTYVQSGKTWDTSAETELRVGTYDAGSTKARTFLNFSNAFKGKDIKSASLSINETWSYSCTKSTVTAHLANPASTSTQWSAQPSVTTSKAGSLSAAKGYSSSCAAGRISIPITAIADAWSSSTAATVGLRLSASESDSYGWKKFASRETSTDPYVTYTYNRKPNLASAPTLGTNADGANTYVVPTTGQAQIFTKAATPRFYSKATDPDGNKVAVTFEVHTSTEGSASSKVSSCQTPMGASGASVSCVPGVSLPEDTWYFVRAAVKDDQGLYNGGWSAWTQFRTQRTTPPTPRVSCDRGYSNGAWSDTDPAGVVTCSVTAAGIVGTYRQPAYLDISVGGVAQPRKLVMVTDDWSVVHQKVTFQASQRGYHEIKVTGLSRSLVPTAQVVYGFGWGSASMSTPTSGTASSGTVKVVAGGPPKGTATAVTAKTQWRVAGSGSETTGWTDAAAAPVTLNPSSTSAPTTYTGTFDLTSAIREAGASDDLPSRTPIRLDVQVCFTYAGSSTGVQCTWSESPVTVTRLPHAFGNGYPTADAGVGQVALYTGEVALGGTDVSVPGYSGDITLSRSHVSFAGDGTVAGWPSDPVTGVFGPGWSANLEGGEAGLAGLQVVDNTGLDGSIAFVDGEGEPLVYANPSGTRTYPTTTKTYLPATDDTAASAIKLAVTGSGTGMRLTLTEDDGTTTIWKPKAAPSTTAGTTWIPLSITEPGQPVATTFGHDTTGRVTRIVAAVPDGMAGADCPTIGALARGCRALDITYATTTTANASTPGDFAGQVKAVSAWLWNPATSAMAATTVATYTYDTSGRLRTMRDPRVGLGTDYTWDAASTRVASVTASGLAATKLAYSSGKLSAVTRENPVAGQADVTVARYVYGVPTSGSGRPDLTAASVGRWGQAKIPSTGYAVFGQDYTGPVAGTGVDYSYADLSYVDDLGYTVNTATYGAGAWLVTATDYDSDGNVVRELDASATAYAAAHPELDPDDVNALSTQTFYNDEVTANGQVVLPSGSRVADTYGPVRQVVLADGTEVAARPHTHTEYDQGAPKSDDDLPINEAVDQYFSLPTTVTTGAATPAAAPGEPDIETISTTNTGYAKLSSGDATEGDGWALGQATTTTTGGITRTTRYDKLGRVTDTRQPLSTGNDAGTTKNAYYTVDAQTGANATCGGKPEWAGMVCRTYPAAAPSSGLTLPDATTEYSMWLLPVTVTEKSGGATRTTTTSYDAAERAVSTLTTLAGMSGSTSRPGSYTKYDSTTGLVAYSGWLHSGGEAANLAGRSTYTYDRWGRTTTLVGDAGTVTTSYDAAGRVASVIDARGSTTYGYDGTGERRGLVTSLTVSRHGGKALTWGAAYDADGNMTTQTLPGRITQKTTYDEAGEPVQLQYLGQVTPVTAGGTDPDTGETIWTPGAAVQDQPWMTWSVGNDVTGRVRTEATGMGAAFDTGEGVGSIDDVESYAQAVGHATSTSREYRYDAAGRLVHVTDAASTLDQDTGGLAASCTERDYSFDKNGRRTALATITRADGDCESAGTTATVTTTGWDTADRPTTGRGGAGSYVYDLLGRQTTLPAADAPDTSAGNISLRYYFDDLPRSVTQGGTSTTFTLDAEARRSVQTTTDAAGTTTTTRRYTDSGDNPAWVEVSGPAGGATTRFAESIGGDLSASIDDTADAATRGDATLSLATLHGDVATTVAIPATQTSTASATAINGWASYDEYGNTTTADPVDGPIGYGWLGAKQRSTTTDTAGLTLMGVRYYNPTRGLFTALDPIPGGNDTAYAYPNDPVNTYDLDGRRWSWRKVGRWAWKHKWDIALTASMFIPGVGIAGMAVRGAVWAARGARAYNSAKKVKYAMRVSNRFNGGRARVTIPRRNGKMHYDLHGRSHGGVKTPHKFFHYNGRPGYMGKKGPHSSMNWRDLARVRWHLRRR